VASFCERLETEMNLHGSFYIDIFLQMLEPIKSAI
jgi:hypothetical protein